MLESFPALTQAVVTPSCQKSWGWILSLFQVCRAPPNLGAGAASGVLHPDPLKCFSPFPLVPPSSGVQDPPALTLALTPTHRTHIWTHFQVDLLLVVVPQLLGGLGFFGDVGFLGVLDEIRVVFPSAGREVGKGQSGRWQRQGEHP